MCLDTLTIAADEEWSKQEPGRGRRGHQHDLVGHLVQRIRRAQQPGVHEFRGDRRGGGKEESLDDPKEERQRVDGRQGDPVGRRERGDGPHDERAEEIREEHDRARPQAVAGHAAEDHEDGPRDRLQHQDRAERPAASRQRKNQPGEGHELELVPDERDRLPDPEVPVVADAERRQQGDARGRPRGLPIPILDTLYGFGHSASPPQSTRGRVQCSKGGRAVASRGYNKSETMPANLTPDYRAADAVVADYPFTPRVPLPGMVPFENVQIQLVDLPPLTADLSEGWLYGIIRSADAALIVVDLADEGLLNQTQTGLDLLEKA